MNTTVSMGAIGTMEQDRLNRRWKGLLTDVHERMPAVISTLQGILESCTGQPRITARLFLGADIDLNLVRIMQLSNGKSMLVCEGLLPIRQGGIGSLAYFGSNTRRRRSSLAIQGQQWDLLEDIAEKERHQRELPPGFTKEVLAPKPQGEDVCGLLTLFGAAFTEYIVDFVPSVVENMIRSGKMAVVRNPKGRIVATSQAESVELTLNGQVWQLVELSDTAADPEYEGQGLSQHCKALLIGRLQKNPHTIIYTESRANHGAVLRQNWNLGMVPAGYLPQHCVMDSSRQNFPQQGTFADLFVFHLPQR